MSVARAGLASAVFNGKLMRLVVVGLSSVEVFDPLNGNWSAGVALPSEVNRGTAITVRWKDLSSRWSTMPLNKKLTKFFALIHRPVNGVQKPICPRLGME